MGRPIRSWLRKRTSPRAGASYRSSAPSRVFSSIAGTFLTERSQAKEAKSTTIVTDFAWRPSTSQTRPTIPSFRQRRLNLGRRIPRRLFSSSRVARRVANGRFVTTGYSLEQKSIVQPRDEDDDLLDLGGARQ